MARQGRQQGGDKPAETPQRLSLGPGRFVQAQIPCFCLEYGNPDPTSRIPYVIRPLEELHQRSEVGELMAQFAEQEINQYVAQLAAWHVANGVSWKTLAHFKFPRTPTSRGHRVTKAELVAARKLVKALGQNSLSARR